MQKTWLVVVEQWVCVTLVALRLTLKTILLMQKKNYGKNSNISP
jgi:hypothetical protein